MQHQAADCLADRGAIAHQVTERTEALQLEALADQQSEVRAASDR